MNRLLLSILSIISLTTLQSCFRGHYLSQWTHYKFSNNYFPDKDKCLQIDGFYSNSSDTCNPDTLIVLTPDGSVFFKHGNNDAMRKYSIFDKNYGDFGIYNIDNDTLRIFVFSPDDIFAKWNESYYEFQIYERRILKFTKALAPERITLLNNCDNVYYFVPCSIEVPVNPIKYEKWIWADKKQWKQWVKDHPRPDDDDGF